MTSTKTFETTEAKAERLPDDTAFGGAGNSRDSVASPNAAVQDNWAWLVPLIGPIDSDFEKALTSRPTSSDGSGCI
ncbi:virulence-associated protein [Burkholderia sp. IMCC1007]|uniref:virulence-associated protein n=1 Tax=Burkholderia sp. IMCC1007 TaxID=3004104 RepID=UPI0022B45B61|nr:virulence-associated protein [Burkholderia sp. IMCC1007]